MSQKCSRCGKNDAATPLNVPVGMTAQPLCLGCAKKAVREVFARAQGQ